MKTDFSECRVAFLFSGQGSHYFQMGAELLANDRCFRSWMEKLDAIAVKWLDTSVIAKIYDRRWKCSDVFSETRFTHPAIFMVEYAMARTLEERGLRPAALLGVSLGEYAAAAIAGVIELESAFEFVLRQGLLVDAICEPGGMLTILDSPTFFRRTPFLYSRAEIVAENFHQHFVIAGSAPALDEIEKFLSAQDIAFHRLAMTRAFHSHALDPAASRFLEIAGSYHFHAPTLPFYSSVVGGRNEKFDANYFWQLARRRVQFRDALEELDRDGPWIYVDVGPSGTLAGMGRYILGQQSGSEFYPVLTPLGRTEHCLERLLNRTQVAAAPVLL